MKAIITGSNGLLGSALKKSLGPNHIYHTRKDAELLNFSSTIEFFNKNKDADTLIHCAARVGGVQANMNDNLGFFHDNFIINNYVTDFAMRNNIKNYVNILSTCVFPQNPTYPLTSDQIDNGVPHPSNHGYSYAKRLAYYTTKYTREVTGKNWISIIPTNLYGPNDNFNLENSHLVPALIRKAYEASLSGEDFVVWGDGTPLRQFVHSEDMAKIILWAIDNWKSDKPLMAINETEYSIKEIALIIASHFNIPDHRIVFDASKPNGQFRKSAKSDIPAGVIKFKTIEEGLDETIEWFIANYDKIRK